MAILEQGWEMGSVYQKGKDKPRTRLAYIRNATQWVDGGHMASFFHDAMTLNHASVSVFWAREINPPRFSVTVISGAVKNGVLFAEISC